jgi:hypothetical protein
MSTPPLFQSDARKRFMTTTADRYRHLTERLERKKVPLLFTLAQLRSHILDAMGDSFSGGLRCRYCGKICDISEVALDHAVPLSRGGSPLLSNIEMPCQNCNSQKGEREPWEFEALLVFLETKIPMARPGLLKQLQEHSKLLSGKRKAEMLLRNGGNFPKPKKPGKPPLIAAIEERF